MEKAARIGNYDGTIADSILGLAFGGASVELGAAIRESRVAMRSRRPEYMWWLSDSALDELRRISGLAGEGVQPQILDAIGCLDGTLDALTLTGKYGAENLRRAPDTENVEYDLYKGTIELSQEELDKLNGHMETDEPLQLVIRGHLWFESRLIRYLAEAVPQPEYLENSRLNFSQRLNVAAALDLIPEEDLPAIFKLNRLRNKIAHELDAAIGETEERELFNSLSPFMRHIAHIAAGGDFGDFPDCLRNIVMSLIIILDHRHDQLVASKKYNEYLNVRVQQTLGRRSRSAN